MSDCVSHGLSKVLDPRRPTCSHGVARTVGNGAGVQDIPMQVAIQHPRLHQQVEKPDCEDRSKQSQFVALWIQKGLSSIIPLSFDAECFFNTIQRTMWNNSVSI